MSQDELTCSHKMMLKAVEGPMLSIIDDEETAQCYMKMSSVVTRVWDVAIEFYVYKRPYEH